jgi:hypothetical protein
LEKFHTTPDFDLYKILTQGLLKPTGVGFGKALNGLWVNFGRYLVPAKQRVGTSKNWPKTASEMLKFNISPCLINLTTRAPSEFRPTHGQENFCTLFFGLLMTIMPSNT